MAIVGLTVGAMCFTGCTTTKNTDTTTESSQEEDSSDSETQESVTGKVTAEAEQWFLTAEAIPPTDPTPRLFTVPQISRSTMPI